MLKGEAGEAKEGVEAEGLEMHLVNSFTWGGPYTTITGTPSLTLL